MAYIFSISRYYREDQHTAYIYFLCLDFIERIGIRLFILLSRYYREYRHTVYIFSISRYYRKTSIRRIYTLYLDITERIGIQRIYSLYLDITERIGIRRTYSLYLDITGRPAYGVYILYI